LYIFIVLVQIISVLTRCLLFKVWEYWICIKMPGGIRSHKKQATDG